jgi:hypothetical protein
MTGHIAGQKDLQHRVSQRAHRAAVESLGRRRSRAGAMEGPAC